MAGKPNRKGRAIVVGRLHIDFAAMRVRDQLCDVQAKTETFGFVAPIFALSQRFEDPPKFRWRNRRALVVYPDHNVRSASACCDRNGLVTGSVPYAVLNKVRKQLAPALYGCAAQ